MGSIRSGKTLIGRALNMHPNIIVQQEPFFFFFKLCYTIFQRDFLKKDIDTRQPLLPDFCISGQERRLFAESFIDIQFMGQDVKELKRLTIKQQELGGNERAPEIIPFLEMIRMGSAIEVLKDLLTILGKAYQKDDCRYIGFTEAWCDKFIGILLNLQGFSFKCIHAIRDPRAIIASRNAGRNIKQKYGGKYPILFLIRHWRDSIAYSITNREHPYYLSVKYEDLVNSPRLWFENICELLNIPFDEGLIQPERYVDGRGHVWKQNTNFEAGSGFSSKSLFKWKETLSRQEIGFIEYMCRSEMEYFKYRCTQEDFNLHELIDYNEKKDETLSWLLPYVSTLNDSEMSLEIMRYALLNIDSFVPDEIVQYLFGDGKIYNTLLAKEAKS